jgi:hypothetical protein
MYLYTIIGIKGRPDHANRPVCRIIRMCQAINRATLAEDSLSGLFERYHGLLQKAYPPLSMAFLKRPTGSSASSCFPTVASSGRIFGSGSGSGSRARSGRVHPTCSPVLPAAVPMDVDRAQMRPFPCTCFRCGAAGHLAHECPVTSDIRHTDVLDEVIRQLGDDLLDELFACLSRSASLPAESVDGDETDLVGFPIRPSERCALGRIPKSLHPPVFR